MRTGIQVNDATNIHLWVRYHLLFVSSFITIIIQAETPLTIGVVAIGTMGTKVLPDKERNLSTRNQKVLKYRA